MKRNSLQTKTGPLFEETIPEPLRYGLHQCFIKIRMSMRDILELNESDLGLLQQDNKHYIVFRTKALTGKILQKGFLVQEAITKANENAQRRLSTLSSVEEKKHKYVDFELKMPKTSYKKSGNDEV